MRHVLRINAYQSKLETLRLFFYLISESMQITGNRYLMPRRHVNSFDEKKHTSQLAPGASSEEREVRDEGGGGWSTRGDPTVVSTTVVCCGASMRWEGALSVFLMQKKRSSNSSDAAGRLSKGERHLSPATWLDPGIAGHAVLADHEIPMIHYFS